MRSPCLIGWSQVRGFEGEPLDAWAEALSSTGVPAGRVDSLDLVYCQSWPYDDPAARLAERVGARPRRRQYSGIGGTMPLQLLADAARRIATGESEVSAVVGGEALASVRRAKKAGARPDWSHRETERSPFPFEAPFHDAEVAHQLFQAYSTFAQRDVARRARLGTAVEDHVASLGELFAPMTKVAATNPFAWFPQEWTSTELSEPSTDNRLVAYPYTKRLVAVMDVDLVGAVVLASAEAADALGVPLDQRVHLRGWSWATDPVYVAEHEDLSRSPAMARSFEQALSGAGVTVDEISHADLYSCFPSSVSFALDALGLSPGGHLAPYTVTGGLPYAGGPGSAYLLLALAAMADRLVADPGTYGLTSGVGMHMTKHAAAVWSTEPGEVTPPADDPGPATRRTIVDRYAGDATVATYTVHHGRDGNATDAVLICDLAGGARCYGKALDADFLTALEADEWVGRRVQLTDGGDGVNLVTPGS